MKTVFIDTFCLIATSVSPEVNHQRAHPVIERLEHEQARCDHQCRFDRILQFAGEGRASKCGVEHTAVDANTRRRRHHPHHTRELCDRAFNLYGSRSDKDRGRTDGMSFEVMKSQPQCTKAAITAANHFRQAGFEAVM